VDAFRERHCGGSVKEDPEKLFDTFAYSWTEAPPLRVRHALQRANRLATIGLCKAHPYEQCSRNRFFPGPAEGVVATYRSPICMALLHEFLAVTSFRIPTMDELAADIPMYGDHGVVGISFRATSGLGTQPRSSAN
jgi:hypothetical protein